MRIAVIGLGLIGGSIALAARRRLGAEVAGADIDPTVREAALAGGAIDRICPTAADAVQGAHAAFVAVPVG
jgi:prephenate dehydrogenase